MAFLKGNLHAHTTFSDGVRSPQALIEEYESRGYDFLAITDHEDHENWVEPAYPLGRWREALGHAADAGRLGSVKIVFDPRRD